MRTVVRETSKNDYEILVRFFYKNNTPKTTKCFDPFPLNSNNAYRIANYRGQDRYSIMLKSDEVVGLGMLRWWKGYESPTVGILIDKNYRSQGLGKILTKTILDKAKKHSVKRVVCSVYTTNHLSIEMFQSLGFKIFDEKNASKNGKKVKKILLEKRL